MYDMLELFFDKFNKKINTHNIHLQKKKKFINFIF